MTDINWFKRAKEVDLRVRNFINGAYAETCGGETITKYSSRDGSLLYEVNCGNARDADQAVAHAKESFADGRWSRISAQERKDVLLKLADLIEEHKEELALLDCLDVGKPIGHALLEDVPRAVAAIRYCAEAVDKLFSLVADGPAPNLSYQLRKPVGVVAGIIGWNFPLMLAATKVGPALVTGNSLVLKPSEFTSLSASRLAELAVDAGVPPGVFNVVHGVGTIAGATLAHHPDVRLLTFTGSSATGKQMMLAAGQSNMKRLMLECGGKSPYIVFDDCPDDLDWIAQDVVATAFHNQGALCVAGTRVLIQDSIKDKLLPKILEEAAALRPQDPLDPSTTFGAIINEAHMNKVLGYIGGAQQEGARLLCGGNKIDVVSGGYYIEPTIFDDVDPQHKIAREEIFGPVLSVFTFRDEAEAIRMANDTSFGLAAYVCTENIGRAQRLAQNLEAGAIAVIGTATPAAAGGAELGAEPHKESGFGVEGGPGGLTAYTVSSTIHLLT